MKTQTPLKLLSTRSLGIRALVTALCPFAVLSVYAEKVIYVHQAAVGQNDGSDWIDAFVDLHDALAVAVEGDELWIAAGTYRPDRGTGDRAMFFSVPAGVALYGGFAGHEECLDERDWLANETILSGDLNGDDGSRNCAAYSDCCQEHEYHGCGDSTCEELVCASYPECCLEDPLDPLRPLWHYYYCVLSAEASCCNLWQGCENSIAVVRLSDGLATTVIDGLIVEGSYSVHDGPTVIGGGVIGSDSKALILNGIFRWNVPRGASGFADVMVFDSVFEGNRTGLAAFQGEVENSSFIENYGGLGLGDGTVSNCTFVGNEGALSVSGVIGDYAHLTIQDCQFLGNAYVIRLDTVIAEISDSTFLGNSRYAFYVTDTAVSIDRCTFLNNEGWALAGIFVNAAVRNSLFAGTLVFGAGGTIDLSHAALRVENCTFYANGHDDPAPAGITIYGDGSRALVRNTILWSRPDDIYGPEDYLLQAHLGATVEVSHTIIEGWSGALGGVGNSGADPMFVDPLGLDGVPGTLDYDLRLSPGSSAINAGDPNPLGLSSADLDGHARILCGRVDIGAYEFGIGDYNCDQSVDPFDFAYWSGCMTGPGVASIPTGCKAFDFNADSAVDLLDFAQWLHIFVAP